MKEIIMNNLPTENKIFFDARFCRDVNCPTWNIQQPTTLFSLDKSYMAQATEAELKYRFRFKEGWIPGLYYSCKNGDYRCSVDMKACKRMIGLRGLKEAIILRRFMDEVEKKVAQERE